MLYGLLLKGSVYKVANNLLDLLCEKVGCSYVSDLTQDKCRSAVAKAYKELLSQDFDEHQWINAAEYVSSGQVRATTAQQAKDYFHALK